MAIWAVVETYYKHAQFKLHIFYSDGELCSFLYSEIEDSAMDMGLDDLISKAIEIGNENVDNERGWGIREIVRV